MTRSPGVLASGVQVRSGAGAAGCRKSWVVCRWWPLQSSDWRPLNVGLLLQLHGLLFAETKVTGGTFKQSDNLVVDRSPDGIPTVRFKPVPAARTEYYAADLVDRYADAVRAGQHHPVLLVGLFVLDLLVIHPFDDGNGRVARALTNALLAEAGYAVGRYVSLEQLIAESAETTTRRCLTRPTTGTTTPTTRGPGWRTSAHCSRAAAPGSPRVSPRTGLEARSRNVSVSTS